MIMKKIEHNVWKKFTDIMWSKRLTQVDLGRGDTGVFPMEKLIQLYILGELALI